MDVVKVMSGQFRGRALTTPGAGTHPMGAREKLALFNMISAYLPGARVLDAFAGSGALGIEALSRGVAKVVFVERNRRACGVIAANLAALGIEPGNEEIICGEIARVLPMESHFDVVIADPPYDEFDAQEAQLLAQVVARTGGVLVLSHPGDAPEIPGLKLQKTHQYARAHLSVYLADASTGA